MKEQDGHIECRSGREELAISSHAWTGKAESGRFAPSAANNMRMITSPSPGLLLILSSIVVAMAGEGAMLFDYSGQQQHPMEERNLQRRRNPLLRADTSPLEYLTNPHTHYFLEYPLGASLIGAGGAVGTIGPRCSDGSPYSFIFRRGTDPHLRKGKFS